jgi:hypothetical protein
MCLNVWCMDADSDGWAELGAAHPDFLAEARNLIMAMCADGVNPFGLKTVRSVLCIVLSLYNLPAHIRNTYDNLLVWGIVDGKDNSKLALQIFAEQCMSLWEGMPVWDGYHDEVFKVRAMLLHCIHDYHRRYTTSGYLSGNRCTPMYTNTTPT